MKTTTKLGFAGSVIVAGMLVLSGGCGYKTPPVPPQSVVPKAIVDLDYSLDDKGARLTWSYPVETIDGRNLSAIDGFELYRAEIPLDNFCSSCPISFAEPIELPGGVTAMEERQTAQYASGMLRSGNKYFFKVRSRTSWWAASGDSNIVSFVYHTPAAAPQDLKASVDGTSVRLSWSPVDSLIDGGSAELPVTYQVVRSNNGKDFSEIGGLLQKTSFVDTEVASSTTYWYKVKSGMRFEGETLDGSLSPAVQARVLDTTAPPMVTGVTVIASAGDIRVFWDTTKADDLAGYRIYRRLQGEKQHTRVGDTGASTSLFVDTSVPSDTKVYYAVTAIDAAGNESELSKDATTRH